MDYVESTEITGLAKLFYQDNRQVMKKIPDASIDLILTDPPYNISKYSSGNIDLPNRTPLNNDIADWDKIEVDPTEYVEEFKRILNPNGNIFVFTSYNSIGKWHATFDHKFDTAQYMVWHKTNPTPSIFKTTFLKSCELIICFWNKGHVWNFTSQDDMHNFIETPICAGPERLKNPKHPAQKPVQLLEHIIEIASNKNALVFDPFMGVASTAIAALKTGRRFCGCEIIKEYYQAGVDRVKKIYCEKRLLNLFTNERSFSMPEFNHAEELVNVFSKYIFDQASVDYKQQIVINALDKITKDKKRIIGFLRFQTIKEKLTQCISQSYEIKTGYILEDFFEKLFGFHFHNLSKIVNGYKCDQLFEDDNYIYLIEQKIRDDHDTSKRGGQVENFIQKIAALEEKCIQKNKKLKAYMWFVDDNFKKNKSFYAEKLSHIGNENTEEVSLYYGRTIVDYILGNQEIWDNFYSNDYAEVRQSLFSNNLMMNKIKEYFIAHLTPARRTFINRGQENN